MPYDLDGARRAGIPDAEIAEVLAPKLNYDLTGARRAGIPDREIADVLARRYNELERHERRFRELLSPRPQPTEVSLGEAAADIGLSALSSVGGLAEQAGTIAGLMPSLPFAGLVGTAKAFGFEPEVQMDNPLRRGGQRLREFAQGLRSPGYREREAIRRAEIDAASSLTDQAIAAVRSTVSDPLLLSSFITELVPQLAPPLGAARLAMGGARALGAGERAVAATGVGAAVGTGAAMQAADIASAAYDDLLRQPDELWAQNAEFQTLVSTGVAPEQAKQQVARSLAREVAMKVVPLSIAANLLPGGRAIERALAGVKMAGGRLGGAVRGGLGESLAEAVEEGGSAYLANRAVQQVDPSRDPMQGVGEAVGLGALGGFAMGAPAGAIGSRAGQEPPAPLPAGDVLGRPDDTAPAVPPAAPPAAPARELGDPSQIDSMLADANEIWKAATARPGIFDTVEAAAQDLPEYREAQPADRLRLDRALKELQADPKAIFELARSQPEIYRTISRVTRETAKLVGVDIADLVGPEQRPGTSVDTAQTATQTEETVPQPAPAGSDPVLEAFERLERERERQKQRELDLLQQQGREIMQDEALQREIRKAEAAGSGLTEQPPGAMELAFERAGVRPEQFPSTPKTPEEREIETLSRRILSGPVEEVPDYLVSMVAKKGQGKAQLLAKAEAERRMRARAEPLRVEDRNWAERLFAGKPLTREEKRRAIEVGFGYQRPDGSWRLTRRAYNYRKALREQLEQQLATAERPEEVRRQIPLLRRPAVPDERDDFVVRSATAGLASVRPDALSLPADARAAARIAREVFGRRVVFFEYRSDVPLEDQSAGFVDPGDPHTIYLNPHSRFLTMAVTGHEITHTMRRTDPDIYQRLVERLRPLMINVPEYRAWLGREIAYEQALAKTPGLQGEALRKAADRERGRLDPEQLEDLTTEEMTADFMGDHMTQPEFWKRVFDGMDRTLVQRIADAVRRALDAIRARLTGKKGFGSERYIADIDAARDALAQAVREMAARTQARRQAETEPEFDAGRIAVAYQRLKARDSRPAQEAAGRATAPDPERAVRAWQKIAEHDEVFRYGRSKSRILSNVAQEMDRHGLVQSVTVEDGSHIRITLKRAKDERIPPFAIVGLDKGTREAWVDTSSVGRGRGGSLIYQIAMQWAANNGYVFVPDPMGLSRAGAIRRNDNMISAALRLGTTRFMRPGSRQGIVGWREVETPGDANDRNNLWLLLEKQLEYVRQHFPEVDHIWYNFEREEFVDDHGNPIRIEERPGPEGDGDLPQVVFLDRKGNQVSFARRDRAARRTGTGRGDRRSDQAAQAGAFEGGWRTVARAILTKSLAQPGMGEQRDRILGELLRNGAAPLRIKGTPLEGILHSRGERPPELATPEHPAQTPSQEGVSVSAAETAAEGKARGGRPDTGPRFRQFAESLPKKDGRFVGSRGKGVRELRALVREMYRMAREGEAHRPWYRDSARAILAAFDGNQIAAERFIQMIAITSAGSEVKANFTHADKALMQFVQGREIKVGKGHVNNALNDLLYFGIPWEGRKTNTFYLNLTEEIFGKRTEDTTQDRHMAMLGLGKKNLTDAEYSFLNAVTKYVARTLGWEGPETQAAIWVVQKARSLFAYYKERGIHRGKSDEALRRIAMQEAAIHFGHTVGSRGMFWPHEGAAEKLAQSAEGGRGTMITAEVKPSTRFEAGRILQELSYTRLRSWQKEAFYSVFGKDGPGAFFRAFGWDRTKFRVEEGSGGYDATIAPNLVATLNGTREEAELAALAWMYVFRQDAVPYFRARPELADHPDYAQGFRFTFERKLTVTQKRAFYDALRSQVHAGMGYTRTAPNEFVAINFRDESGRPILELTDDEFSARVKALVDSGLLPVRLESYAKFGAETGYPYHDWEADREGRSLRQSLGAAGRPDLLERLDHWADRFRSYAEAQGGLLRSRGTRPGDEGRTVAAAGAEARGVPGRGELPGGARGLQAPHAALPPAATLDGLPQEVEVPGRGTVRFGGFAPAQEAARRYMERAGLPYRPLKRYAKLDRARARRIADAFDEMKHDPQNPQVRAAYDALIRETLAQYQVIKETGLDIDFIEPGMTDPYRLSPRYVILDVVENNHLWVFPTDSGFGMQEDGDYLRDNPLLEFTDEYVKGRRLRANDVFRIVHDYFGHVMHGVGFRAEGEENAWRSHSSMYSPLARRAMTSETRGQNSWVNFGPYGEKNRTASAEDTVYAEQKIGLLPDWVVEEGAFDEDAGTGVQEPLRSRGVRPDEGGRQQEGTIDEAAHQAATSTRNELPHPTQAQLRAGNYAKGHYRIAGLDISVENPEGSVRFGPDGKGGVWSTQMKAHYGYLRGTRGRDKDHIDVFVKPGTPGDYDGPIFVVDQDKRGNGHFDEHKVLIGWPTMAEARAGYLANYDAEQRKHIRAITGFENPAAFKRWLARADTTRPATPRASEYNSPAELMRVLVDFLPRIDENEVEPLETSPELAERALQEHTLRGIVEWIAENSSNPLHRKIARILTPVVDDIPFDVVRTNRWYPQGVPGALLVARGLTLARSDGATWVLVRDDIGLNEATILREAIHAATMVRTALAEGETDTEFSRALAELAALMRQVKAEINKRIENGEHIDELLRTAPFEHIQEFLAWGMTDPRFQNMLRSIEMPTGKSAWQAFVDAILRILGLRSVDSNALERVLDAGFNLIEAVKAEGGPPRSVDTEAMMLAHAERPIFYSALQRKIEEFGTHIEVDGKTRPVTNSEGRPIASTEEGLRAFWRWFGDSKVVDEQGRPLVLYHSTVADFSEFRTDSEMGAHFGTREQAEAFSDTSSGRQTLPVYLSIKNPIRLVDLGTFAWEVVSDQLLNMKVFDLAVAERIREIGARDGAKAATVAVQNELNARGYDGIVYLNRREGADFFGKGATEVDLEHMSDDEVRDTFPSASDSYIAFRPKQIKSAIGNIGTYSARVNDILRRRATHPGQQAEPTALNRAALASAQAAASAVKPVTATIDLVNKALEGVLKQPARLLVRPVTSWIYDRVTQTASSAAKQSPLVQRIAHGMVSNYGLPEPYLDARQDREIAINRHLRKSKALIDRIGSLDRTQARIAYLWMQEQPNTREEQDLLAALPAESRQTLLEMKQQIDELGREAVRLGLLSQESYDRNRMAYLHRTYLKYEQENKGWATNLNRAKTIRAESYRGRGLRDDVAESVVRGAAKGDRYLRLEKRRPDGVLQRVVYLREGTPIPPAMQDWRQDGIWEARFFDKKGEVGMWRDLNPEERLRLGEIDEVRYAFARTVIASVRDIETARFLEWVMQNYSVADAKDVKERGGRTAEAADKRTTVTVYADDEWVQVPMTHAQGTKLYKYGALAGRYIPGHIWNDIRATVNFRPATEVGRLYERLLRGWKIAKTALSPAVHTNNIMANFVLADLADLNAEDLRRALKTLLAAKQGDAKAQALMERYYDSGAESGSFSAIELRAEVIEPILKELESGRNEELDKLSLIQAIQLARGKGIKEGLVTIAHNALLRKGGRMAAAPFKAMIDLYRSEDAVFRFAKFLRGIEQGLSDREAGKEARRAFLDYDINAPWIQAARNTVLPFIAFTYRAVPLLAEAAAKKPWKMMKYFVVGSALNQLAYLLLGMGDDDEERERRLLPEEKSGRVLGVFPRLIRMPWNDEHGSPVFLDVRRWVPAGDIFDVQGSFAAIPLPQWLTIGGPLALMIELVSNKSMFTGRPIWKGSDTVGEKIARVMDHVFKFAAPNLPLPNPVGYPLDTVMLERGLMQTYSWKAIQAAGTGETDAFGRERSLGQAVAGAFGVKLGSYPADVAQLNLAKKRAAELREVGERESELRRQLARRGLTEEQFAERMQRQQEKRREILKRYGEKLGLEPIE